MRTMMTMRTRTTGRKRQRGLKVSGSGEEVVAATVATAAVIAAAAAAVVV
jgi:hypothetical protein